MAIRYLVQFALVVVALCVKPDANTAESLDSNSFASRNQVDTTNSKESGDPNADYSVVQLFPRPKPLYYT